MRIIPNFLQTTIFAATLAVLMTAFGLPGNAVDLTIEFINSKIFDKCEDCKVQDQKQNGHSVENSGSSGVHKNLQISSTNHFYNNKSPAGLQLAQNEVTIASKGKKKVSEMRATFLKLMRDPSNVKLNLLYAELAEKSGKLNKALVTYERLALLEPNNIKWEKHVRRLRELSQPPETAIAAVLGARFDRNGPLNADSVGNRAGYNASLVLTLDHKRSIGGLKYQATGQFFTDYNVTAAASDLYLGAFQFGPLLSFLDTWQVRPALLLERSFLNRRKQDSLSYSTGTILNFQNLEGGSIRTVDVSMYYVNFHDETPGKDAIVWTGSSGIEYQGFTKASTVRLTPNITYNRARSGIGTDGFRDQYYEVGFDFSYTQEFTESFELGPTVSYRYREFMDYEPSGNTPRTDRNFIFGLEAAASDWIPEIIILGAYNWERNKSLLEGNTYTNHSIAMNFIKSF